MFDYKHASCLCHGSHQVPPNDGPGSHNFFTWFKQCFSVLNDTIKTCVRQNLDSFVALKGEKVHVNSTCCGVVKEYYDDCASKSVLFEPEMLFIGWLMGSCGHQKKASPSLALGNQPPSAFKPPALKLPKVFDGGFIGGCREGSGVTYRCWRGVDTVYQTCCVLKRFKGVRCDNGKPYDSVKELCCNYDQHKEGGPVLNKCFMLQNPSYVGSLG